MQYVQPELELLLLHIKQVEQHIAGQRKRVERLKELGGATEIAQNVLATMMKVHETLNACVGRITAPSDPDKMSESEITGMPAASLDMPSSDVPQASQTAKSNPRRHSAK